MSRVTDRERRVSCDAHTEALSRGDCLTSRQAPRPLPPCQSVHPSIKTQISFHCLVPRGFGKDLSFADRMLRILPIMPLHSAQ